MTENSLYLTKESKEQIMPDTETPISFADADWGFVWTLTLSDGIVKSFLCWNDLLDMYLFGDAA